MKKRLILSKNQVILKYLNYTIMEMILNFCNQHCLLIVIICGIALIISDYDGLFHDVSAFTWWLRSIFWSSIAAFAIVAYLDIRAFWLFALLAFGINGLASWLVDVVCFFFLDYDIDDYPEDDDIEPENDEFEN